MIAATACYLGVPLVTREMCIRDRSMAEVVREAVSEYLERRTSEARFAVLDETFGAVPEWQDVDSVEHVRSLRSDWDDRRKRVMDCLLYTSRCV